MPLAYTICMEMFGMCEDDWHESYENAPEDGTAWLGDFDSNRISTRQFSLRKMSQNWIRKLLKRESLSEFSSAKVIRGGSWGGNPFLCRSAYRGSYIRGVRYDLIGFRVVCVAPRTT